MNASSALWVLLIFVIGFAGCGQRADPENGGAAGDSLKMAKDTVVQEVKPEQINVYLDVSGSMKGLMPRNGQTDFQVKVPFFLSRLEREFPQARLKFFRIADAGSGLREERISNAKDTLIPEGNISQWAGTTHIPDMIKAMQPQHLPTTISLLITDGIYSPGKGAQKHQLEKNMYEAFGDVPAAALYAFKSDLIDGKTRIDASPYYFIALGRQSNLLQLTPILEELYDSAFCVDHFGFSETIPFYTIIPDAENTGAGEFDPCAGCGERFLSMNNVDIAAKPAFWVGLDLSACPSFAREDSYLQKNLSISNQGVQATIANCEADKSNFVRKFVPNEQDKRLAARCSYFVRINITRIDAHDGAVLLSLKRTRPDWIGAYDKPDTATAGRERTAGLGDLVAGIEEAYRKKGSGFLFRDLNISILKK